MSDQDFIDLKGLSLQSSDFLSAIKTYSLYPSYSEIIKSLKEIPSTFTIITKNNKHQCHMEILAAVSPIVFDAIKSNPKLTEFSIGEDFDDSKFDQFVSFLNGDKIKITEENRQYFQSVADLLKINNINFDLSKQKEIFIKQFTSQLQTVLSQVSRTVTISTHRKKYQVNYLIAFTYCQVLKKVKASTDDLAINLEYDDDIIEIVNFLNDKAMVIRIDNLNIIKNYLKSLGISLLDETLNSINSTYDYFGPTYSSINLQEVALSINESNVDSVAAQIAKSEYSSNSSYFNELLLSFETAYRCRPANFIHIMSVIRNLAESNVIKDFHSSLLTYLRMRVKSSNIFVPFLRHLYDEGFVYDAEVLEFLNLEKQSIINEYVFNTKFMDMRNELTFYFAKHMYDKNPEEFKKQIQNTKSPYYRSFYAKKIEDLECYLDHWDLYENDSKSTHFPDALYEAIFKDDVDTFQRITSQKADFQYFHKINMSIFEKNPELGRDFNYADLAAFYGSVKCFRFLSLQEGADVSRCARHAICGGNSEIIRMVEHDKGNFSDEYSTAIKFHRPEIYKWLCVNYGTPKNILDETDVYSNKQSLMRTAIAAYNNTALLGFAEERIDNKKFSGSTSYFGLAVLFMNVHAQRILLKTFLVDPNKIGIGFDESPLYLAAAVNCLDTMKLLVEVGKCKIPVGSEHNPLKKAAKMGFEEAVKYLAPLYKDKIDQTYIDSAKDDKIKQILLDAKK